MKIRWSILLLLTLIATGAAAAQARRELVGKIFHRGANDEQIPEKGVPITLEPSGATTRSNDKGVFRLPLPAFVRPDDEVSLSIDKEGWRIRYPLDGELRVPAEPERHVVEVELLPAGSKLFWSNDRVEKFIEDAIRQSAAKPSREGETREDKVLDFSRTIRDWALRYGLSAEAAKAEIDRWIGEVQMATEKDERKLGLAAFAEQQFEKAALHFGLAAEAGVDHLTEIEAAEKSLAEKKEESRKAVVENFRDQARAEYSARRFEAAIAAYGSALRHVSIEQDRQTWAALWNSIGLAHLQEVGRGTGPVLMTHLPSSVAAHRKVLEVIGREKEPRDWANTQVYLGWALFMQSAHATGESQQQQTDEAFFALHSAFEVLSRGTYPQDWATAQLYLGNALILRTWRDPEGAERILVDALAAFRNALEIFTREKFPQHWAMLQSRIGLALLAQSNQKAASDATANELLSQAVSAHRSALEVFNRDWHPQEWARTQASMGHVLSDLSYRSDQGNALKLLDEVILALRGALEVAVRDSDPQWWAHTQIHLGQALLEVGERKPVDEGRRLFGEAERCHRLALEVYTREDLPISWAWAQFELGRALRGLGMRTSGEEGKSNLGKASEALRRALEVYGRREFPRYWAQTKQVLGEVLLEQGRRAGGEERSRLINEAVGAYRHALEVYTLEESPHLWKTTQSELESALQEQAIGASAMEPGAGREDIYRKPG